MWDTVSGRTNLHIEGTSICLFRKRSEVSHDIKVTRYANCHSREGGCIVDTLWSALIKVITMGLRCVRLKALEYGRLSKVDLLVCRCHRTRCHGTLNRLHMRPNVSKSMIIVNRLK